jgi:uncharacterized protein (UPF0332 family)
MSFNWADFLTLANALVRSPNSPGPEEASLRSAISRAYYAAFRVARNFGRDRGELIPTETGRDHRLVRDHFKSSPDRIRRKIGLDLGRLYDNRTSADYDDVLAGRPVSLAQSSVTVARNVLTALDSLQK